MGKGVLYVATGNQYIKECIESAKSLKLIHPDYQTCIFSDTEGDLKDHFDIVKVIGNPCYNFHDKVYGIRRSPFEQTLFLDTDTLVIKPLDELFEALAYFDMGFALDASICSGDERLVPKTFVEPNSGVLVFKNNEQTRSLFERWELMHSKEEKVLGKLCPDQPSLRAVLYDSDVRFFVLPYGYNFITNRAIPIESFTDIRIVHGREPWAKTIGNNPVLNDLKLIKRVYLPGPHFRATNVVMGGYHFIPEFCFRFFRGLAGLINKKRA